MKIITPILTFAALTVLSLPALAASATPSDLGVITTFPGSSTDFSLFGNASTYGNSVGGDGGQPTDLTNFSVAQPAVSMYGGNGGYSTVTAPNGSAYETGIFFSYSATSPFATVTLGNSAGFNYGDFNLYVLYGNVPGDGTATRDASIYVAINGTAYTQAVSDLNSSTAQADAVEFNITGLSAGDQFTIGATKANGANVGYIGGVSFTDAPEPSTYAMMGLGLLALVGIRRFRQLS